MSIYSKIYNLTDCDKRNETEPNRTESTRTDQKKGGEGREGKGRGEGIE